MRVLVFALLLATSMAGSARADCDPYVDLFESYMLGFVAMHDPKTDSEDRTDAANAVGYLLGKVYTAAKDRQLDKLQECTRRLFAGLGQDLPADADLAYSVGWSGVLHPDNNYGASPDSIRKQVISILADAEKIAAIAAELPPVIAGVAPVSESDVEGVWQGVELTIVIQGKSQVKPLGSISASFEADGTYKMGLSKSQSDTGRWHLDGSVLSLLNDQGDKRILEYSVSLQGGMMQWEATKHDGQWIEKWVWQR